MATKTIEVSLKPGGPTRLIRGRATIESGKPTEITLDLDNRRDVERLNAIQSDPRLVVEQPGTAAKRRAEEQKRAEEERKDWEARKKKSGDKKGSEEGDGDKK